jgi:hypothetical protein
LLAWPASTSLHYTLSGPPLIVSEAPLRIRRPGALYRDTLFGRYVLFAHHVNATREVLRVGVAWSNPGPFTVVLNGLHLTAEEGGRIAFRSNPHPGPLVLGPGTHIIWAVPVAPSASLIVHGTGSVTFPEEGVFYRWANDVHLPAPIVTTLYASSSKPAHPDRLPVLPPGRGALRGTFRHAYAVSDGRVLPPQLPLGSLPLPLVSRFWNSLGCPWPAGTDMVDGRTVFDLRLVGVSRPPSGNRHSG